MLRHRVKKCPVCRCEGFPFISGYLEECMPVVTTIDVPVVPSTDHGGADGAFEGFSGSVAASDSASEGVSEAEDVAMIREQEGAQQRSKDDADPPQEEAYLSTTFQLAARRELGRKVFRRLVNRVCSFWALSESAALFRDEIITSVSSSVAAASAGSSTSPIEKSGRSKQEMNVPAQQPRFVIRSTEPRIQLTRKLLWHLLQMCLCGCGPVKYRQGRRRDGFSFWQFVSNYALRERRDEGDVEGSGEVVDPSDPEEVDILPLGYHEFEGEDDTDILEADTIARFREFFFGPGRGPFDTPPPTRAGNSRRTTEEQSTTTTTRRDTRTDADNDVVQVNIHGGEDRDRIFSYRWSVFDSLAQSYLVAMFLLEFVRADNQDRLPFQQFFRPPGPPEVSGVRSVVSGIRSFGTRRREADENQDRHSETSRRNQQEHDGTGTAASREPQHARTSEQPTTSITREAPHTSSQARTSTRQHRSDVPMTTAQDVIFRSPRSRRACRGIGKEMARLLTAFVAFRGLHHAVEIASRSTLRSLMGSLASDHAYFGEDQADGGMTTTILGEVLGEKDFLVDDGYDKDHVHRVGDGDLQHLVDVHQHVAANGHHEDHCKKMSFHLKSSGGKQGEQGDDSIISCGHKLTSVTGVVEGAMKNADSMKKADWDPLDFFRTMHQLDQQQFF
ncbi:unnamed protein product [Amoebophrya sp. A25]|nr:unnamed protein product [Amoebophrya sp. A25]|eukprot:GSA25T00018091001.1